MSRGTFVCRLTFLGASRCRPENVIRYSAKPARRRFAMRLPKIVTRPWAILILGFVAGVVCAGGIVGWYGCRSWLHAQVDCNLTAAYVAADTLATLRTH